MFDLTPEEWTAVALSLRIALVATVVSLPFGIAVAWLLARKDFWGKALLDGVVHLPLVLPPVVTGYLLLITFGRKGAVGGVSGETFGIVFSFRWTGAALACGVMAFPLLVRAIRLSFEAIDRRLEDAAATLGANRLWAFAHRDAAARAARRHRRHGAGFAKALGEFGATITFVSNIPGETQTISAAIYTFTQIPGGDAAAVRLVIVAIVIALAALVASEWFARRAGMRYHGDEHDRCMRRSTSKSGSAISRSPRSSRPPAASTALFGPSGSGKTSIVNMIAGLRHARPRPHRARRHVLFDSAARIDVPAHRRRIGYVFQEGRLFPHLTVAQNLDYGRWMSGVPHDPAERERIVALLDIGALLTRRPGHLSGGERQRVAFGRALLMKPRLLLLDEPLASLDRARKLEILPYLARLRDEAKVPMIYVSHQAGEILQALLAGGADRGRPVAAAGGLELLDAEPSDDGSLTRAVRMFPPARIVCLTEETVETLYLLGEERRIVGVSGYAVRPPRVRGRSRGCRPSSPPTCRKSSRSSPIWC